MLRQDYRSFFEGKRITLMGLGLLGRGAGDAEFLAKCGAELTVTDLKSETELRSSVARLKKFPNVRFVLGGHKLEDFHSADLVIKSAGVPLLSPFIAEARAQGVPVAMSTALFAQLSGAVIAGVTGTRGKSTTTHLLYEMLKESGKKVHLGGNVRGVSTLALLPKIKEGDIAVLELDSWQLQGFGDAGISPHVAVFTNFLPDHLNYYAGDMDAYLKDKAQIFLHQKAGDHLVVGKRVAPIVREYWKKEGGKGELHIAKELPSLWKLGMPGRHNRENAALAALAARILGASDKAIQRTLKAFKGVPGRLELLREVRGVKVYNDTTATTPDATLAALQALVPKQPILIMGGADKSLDMNKLVRMLPRSVKKLVLLPGSGTEKLVLPRALEKKTVRVTNLSGAVREAFASSRRGDVILFSPAFASFGMFKNEFDRGEQFIRLIQSLK